MQPHSKEAKMVKKKEEAVEEVVVEEVVVEEMAVTEVDVEEELVEAAPAKEEFVPVDRAGEPLEEKPKKAKKPNKLALAQAENVALRNANAQVHEILDARAGGGLTVRTFQQISAEIKALLAI
jgi:hypothetical protein